MPQQIGGQPANVVPPLTPVAIASSTNATPIVVTTSANHGINQGDWFFINGHTTNTNANGLWRAGAVTGTTVTLLNADGTNSTGNGVGGASGWTQCYAFGATAPEPSDGDAPNAASVDVMLQMLTDRTAFQWVIGRARRQGKLPNFNAKIGTEVQVWIGGAESAARTYTLRRSGSGLLPLRGQRLRVVNAAISGFALTFLREDASTLCVLPAGSAGWVDLEFGFNAGLGNAFPDWGVTAWGGGATSISPMV